MVKHYCDRCGKERAYTALRTLSVRDWEDATHETYEICEDCEKELKSWIKNETPIDKYTGGNRNEEQEKVSV